jgi:GTPase SAR1 family protein
MREGQWSQVQGFLIVYSVIDYVSFKEIEKIISLIHQIHQVNNFPIVLVGNKSDLEKERKVPLKDGQNLAAKYKIPFMEVSAKNKTNVVECFEKLTQRMLEYQDKKTQQKSFCAIL